MASHITPHHGIIDSDGLGVFTPLRCCGPVTHFCLQTTPEYSLLPAELQPIFTYYSTFASPWAKDLRIGKAKPIAPPRPPQTPAASSKSLYRKCAGGIHLWTHAAARRRRICDRELRFIVSLVNEGCDPLLVGSQNLASYATHPILHRAACETDALEVPWTVHPA